MKALFFGSIGAVAETSDIQRQAYNQALQEAGLDWHWDEDTYRQLLGFSGGLSRLDLLGKACGIELSEETMAQIHSRKTELACAAIRENGLEARPGVIESLKAAKEGGLRVAWVTSTSRDNVEAILDGIGSNLDPSSFDKIFIRKDCSEGKPSPKIYQKALKEFRLEAREAIAVEDSLPSVLSAKRAGVYTIATPGAFHDEDLVGIADRVEKDLTFLPEQIAQCVAAMAGAGHAAS